MIFLWSKKKNDFVISCPALLCLSSFFVDSLLKGIDFHIASISSDRMWFQLTHCCIFRIHTDAGNWTDSKRIASKYLRAYVFDQIEKKKRRINELSWFFQLFANEFSLKRRPRKAETREQFNVRCSLCDSLCFSRFHKRCFFYDLCTNCIPMKLNISEKFRVSCDFVVIHFVTFTERKI